MAISVERIINSLSPSYRIRLVAGKKEEGEEQEEVNWISVVEDYSTEKFKNRKQIIVTSGINMKKDEELLILAKNLYKFQTKALILNIGKYIKSVPKDLIEYCDFVGLPLYTVPWDVFMSDVVRDISRLIIFDESENMNVTKLIQSIIFNTENMEILINKLSFYGYSDKSFYCPVSINIEPDSKIEPEIFFNAVKRCCEKTYKELGKNIILFLHSNIVALVFVDVEAEGMRRLMKNFMENLTTRFLGCEIHICVGKMEETIYNLSFNFKKLMSIKNLAVIKREDILYYDEIGMYEILLEVRDIKLLKNIYEKSLGKLIRYDAETGTDLARYIKIYIELEGNVQSVASKLFVHRNTVNNQLRKIREITNINPLSLDGKIMFSTAIKIEELYYL